MFNVHIMLNVQIMFNVHIMFNVQIMFNVHIMFKPTQRSIAANTKTPSFAFCNT